MSSPRVPVAALDDHHTTYLRLSEAPSDSSWRIGAHPGFQEFDLAPSASLWAKGQEWSWDSLSDPQGVTFSPGRIEIDTLMRNDHGEEVRVAGHLDASPLVPIGPIDAAVLSILKAASETGVRPYSTIDSTFADHDYRTASVLVASERADEVRASVRSQLPGGWQAWLGHRESATKQVELVVGAATLPEHVVRYSHIDPVNYNLHPELVAERLMAWHAVHGVDILQSDGESMEIALLRAPQNVSAFAAELAEFCPDIVQQGVGTVDRLAETIAKDGRFHLWWD